jgi:hypothetical protein
VFSFLIDAQINFHFIFYKLTCNGAILEVFTCSIIVSLSSPPAYKYILVSSVSSSSTFIFISGLTQSEGEKSHLPNTFVSQSAKYADQSPIELPPIPVLALSFGTKLLSTNGFNVLVTNRMYFFPCPFPTVLPTLYRLSYLLQHVLAIMIIFPILYSDITASFCQFPNCRIRHPH